MCGARPGTLPSKRLQGGPGRSLLLRQCRLTDAYLNYYARKTISVTVRCADDPRNRGGRTLGG